MKGVVYNFYKALFGKQEDRNVHLSEHVLAQERRLDSLDIEKLRQPFTEEEVKNAIFYMKIGSTLGPDGFSVTFYRTCWEIIKGCFMEMVQGFYKGNLDIGRLNYVVVALIPKLHNVVKVRQFCPICPLNVSLKIFSELLMDILTLMAEKFIDMCQTTFIKGRYIVDGVVILHETLHDLKRKTKRGHL